MQSLGPLHQSTKDANWTTIQIHHVDETRGLLQAPVTLQSKTPNIAMIHNILGGNASLHFFCRNGFELHPREVVDEGEHIFIAKNKATALQHIAQYHIASEFMWSNVSPEEDESDLAEWQRKLTTQAVHATCELSKHRLMSLWQRPLKFQESGLCIAPTMVIVGKDSIWNKEYNVVIAIKKEDGSLLMQRSHPVLKRELKRIAIPDFAMPQVPTPTKCTLEVSLIEPASQSEKGPQQIDVVVCSGIEIYPAGLLPPTGAHLRSTHRALLPWLCPDHKKLLASAGKPRRAEPSLMPVRQRTGAEESARVGTTAAKFVRRRPLGCNKEQAVQKEEKMDIHEYEALYELSGLLPPRRAKRKALSALLGAQGKSSLIVNEDYSHALKLKQPLHLGELCDYTGEKREVKEDDDVTEDEPEPQINNVVNMDTALVPLIVIDD